MEIKCYTIRINDINRIDEITSRYLKEKYPLYDVIQVIFPEYKHKNLIIFNVVKYFARTGIEFEEMDDKMRESLYRPLIVGKERVNLKTSTFIIAKVNDTGIVNRSHIPEINLNDFLVLQDNNYCEHVY
jgi:hypothetical protein